LAPASAGWRQRISFAARGPNARVLLLDNHDDFGGHAKRNEFELDGQLRLDEWRNAADIGCQSASIQRRGRRVLKAIGIDVQALAKVIQPQDPDFYRFEDSRQLVCSFDRETFGADHLAAGYRHKPWREFLAHAPLSAAAKRDFERLATSTATTCRD